MNISYSKYAPTEKLNKDFIKNYKNLFEEKLKNVFIVASFAVNHRHEHKILRRYQSQTICPSSPGKCP